jgi:hypothetical protein
VSSHGAKERKLDVIRVNGGFMPVLTLEELDGFSEEELRQILREEAMKAGFAEECSNDEEASRSENLSEETSESATKDFQTPYERGLSKSHPFFTLFVGCTFCQAGLF